MKTAIKLLSALVVGAVGISCAGVYATWQYSGNEVLGAQENLSVSMSQFSWEGSEILPSDVAKQNHLQLITEIVEDLNEEGSDLNNQIDTRQNWRRDEFGSMDAWMENRMEQLFGLDTTGLSFLLYFPTDEPETQYLYTTNIDMGASYSKWSDGAPNIPYGSEYVYQVYQTKLQLVEDEEGKASWTAVETKLGYAVSDSYPNTIAGGSVIVTPSIDPTKWTEGKCGTTKDTAIYTYLGQSTTIYADAADELIWYKVTPDSVSPWTIRSYNTKCTITVYKANGEFVATSAQTTDAAGKACVSVSWSGNVGQQYYFTLQGDTAIDFTIS